MDCYWTQFLPFLSATYPLCYLPPLLPATYPPAADIRHVVVYALGHARVPHSLFAS